MLVAMVERFHYLSRLSSQGVKATPCLPWWFYVASVTTPSASFTAVIAIISYWRRLSLWSSSNRFWSVLFIDVMLCSAHLRVSGHAFKIRNLWCECYSIVILCTFRRNKRLDKISCLSFYYCLLACLPMLLVASSDYIRRSCNCSVHVITVRDRDLSRRPVSRLYCVCEALMKLSFTLVNWHSAASVQIPKSHWRVVIDIICLGVPRMTVKPLGLNTDDTLMSIVISTSR